ncbi:MAG TPA: choice-of-anchor L domain-containing protein, partial [Bacteroidales bacterium]|nr:choice-of-anchor L domain-containing protein [Bacteroidales bacterium]
MKTSALTPIIALLILTATVHDVYSQKSIASPDTLLKVRIPQENAAPGFSGLLKKRSGESDASAGSISVNEDPYYTAMTPAQLVQEAFITGCLTASNVKFGYYRQVNSSWVWFNHSWGNVANRQMGYFKKNGSGFPIDEGLILTTGTVSSAMGPNNMENMSQLMVYGATDPDLTNISGQPMNDASVLEFDFVPAGNTMEFKYVFSSEEYLEYVNTAFNDAFGFFLSGPGINGPYHNSAVNLALLPNGDPVTINTIHPSGTNIIGQNYLAQNDEYYIDNPIGSLTYQYDGGTVVLTATYPVIPCQTYHIKLSVADAYDQEFDGAVFLAAKSFNSGNLILKNYGNSIEGLNNVFEGCTGSFRIERSDPDVSKDLELYLELSGTCTNGVDIKTTDDQPFPSTVIIPANVQYVDIPYYAVTDGIPDNGETLIISILTTCPCVANLAYVSETINIHEQFSISSVVATDAICHDQSNGTLTVNCTGGSGYYQYSINNGVTWQNSNIISNLAPGTYTVKVRDVGSCLNMVTGTASIGNPPAIVANAGSNVTICSGQSTQLNGSGGALYSWSPATGLSATNIANPVANPSSTTIYTLTVTNAAGLCPSTANVTVFVNPSPVATISPAIPEICKGSSVTLTAGGGTSYSWNPGGATTASITVSPAISTNYTVTATASNGCSNQQSVLVVVKDTPLTFNITGGGTICSSSTGTPVGLSGSQTGVLYQLKLNGNNTGSPVSGTGSAISFGNQTAAGTYTVVATNTSTSCTSNMTGSVTIIVNTTPAAPTIGTITQPTCTVATGSVQLNGLPTGTWTINPGAITGSGTSYTITGLTSGTYNFTVTNSLGCTSAASANAVINSQPATPAAPVLTSIVQPTCSLATGSVTLTGLPAGSWVIDPGAIAGSGTSKTITGLASGTYYFTVTNAVGCISPTSAAALINVQPVTPSVPVVGTITQPTCSTATGSVVLSGLPSGNWILNPGGITGNTTTKTITNLTPGTYSYTVTNADGCTSGATTPIT